MFSWITAVILFFIYGVIDALYTLWVINVVKLNPFKSAAYAAIMHVLSCVGILFVINNPLYVIPVALGSFCFTYGLIIIKRGKIQ
jgi:hypothetical protein